MQVIAINPQAVMPVPQGFRVSSQKLGNHAHNYRQKVRAMDWDLLERAEFVRRADKISARLSQHERDVEALARIVEETIEGFSKLEAKWKAQIEKENSLNAVMSKTWQSLIKPGILPNPYPTPNPFFGLMFGGKEAILPYLMEVLKTSDIKKKLSDIFNSLGWNIAEGTVLSLLVDHFLKPQNLVEKIIGKVGPSITKMLDNAFPALLPSIGKVIGKSGALQVIMSSLKPALKSGLADGIVDAGFSVIKDLSTGDRKGMEILDRAAVEFGFGTLAGTMAAGGLIALGVGGTPLLVGTAIISTLIGIPLDQPWFTNRAGEKYSIKDAVTHGVTTVRKGVEKTVNVVWNTAVKTVNVVNDAIRDVGNWAIGGLKKMVGPKAVPLKPLFGLPW